MSGTHMRSSVGVMSTLLQAHTNSHTHTEHAADCPPLSFHEITARAQRAFLLAN